MELAQDSPDVEAFSTPPMSPMDSEIRPSLSRRSSKPSNLHLASSAAQWTPHIVLDQQQSPDVAQPKAQSISSALNGYHTDHSSPSPPSMDSDSATAVSHNGISPPVSSPYFVHSQLQGASFKDWLHAKQCKAIHDARMEHQKQVYEDGTIPESYAGEGDDEYAGSLTRQLAETAVGVREMSKQLGRTRVHSHIHNVLIVTKARDNRLIKLTRQLALYLMLKQRTGERGMVVYVDAQLRTSRRFDAAGMEREHPGLFAPVLRRRTSNTSTSSKDDNAHQPEGQLRYWTADMCSRSPHLFDFVVTLGGDGTVLFTSWLFQRIVPPVLPFALGSLGFLTNFDFADHAAVMDSVIDNGIRVNLRMRFTCTVYRAVAPEKGKWSRRAVKKGDTGEIMMKNLEQGGWEALESGGPPHEKHGCAKDKEIMCFTTRPVESFEVLNDLVVDRGPSPYVSLLELFGDEHHLTTVQADGLCIATPTGSTAYSLSAGGSLVHPEIPAILISPICPHTLSFRPMLLPDSMELRISVPFNSRSTAWASFDGRGRVELKQGDHIKVTASKYPFPTVCADTQSIDWFNSITRTLKWNERERQKSFVVVEEGPSQKHHKQRKFSENGEHPHRSQPPPPTSRREPTSPGPPPEGALSDEEDEVSEDEDEKFDIDDLSSNESPISNGPAETAAESTKVSEAEEAIGREKVGEETQRARQEHARVENAARLLSQGNPFLQKSRSRSRTRSGLQSGLETPDRFAGPHPHPPKISPRHVQFMSPQSSSSSLSSIADRSMRQEMLSPHASHSRSRTPRTREAEAENVKTPMPSEGSWRRRVSRSRSRERPHPHETPSHSRRAFAVWGQDESDSATSDSDV